MNRSRPPQRRPAKGFLWRAPRQLTVGECIAMARYGVTIIEEEGPITEAALLNELDRMEVCTTCGWSRRVHETPGIHAQTVGLCAQWTRELSTGDIPA